MGSGDREGMGKGAEGGGENEGEGREPKGSGMKR
jgi:hypothetical protein